MGVLNVTPDSFSDGGLYIDPSRAVERALEMEEEGADLIDIGGESSRPGSDPVSEEEEIKRVVPVIEKLSHRLKIPISVDTSKSRVAKIAVKAGASIINDISGLRLDPEMVHVVADSGIPVVIMHMKGTPKDMQVNPTYNNVVSEVIEFLKERIKVAIDEGVSKDKIIIDPGIGFGKTVEHNIVILRRLDEFKVLGRPILIGTSRKSFIGKILDLEVNERIEGTAATVAVAILKGAALIRAHDVKEMVRVARMTDAIIRASHHLSPTL
ncbi:MAG: dihydropteroate synthase [Nitrospirota bacterium]